MMNASKKIKYSNAQIDAELLSETMAKEIVGSPTKQWSSPYTQQGDCLLVKAEKASGEYFANNFDRIPDDAEELEGVNLVLKGRNNSHALYGGDFTLLKDKNSDQLFVRVVRPCVLSHVKDLSTMKRVEHFGHWIPSGDYYFRGLVETDHVAKLKRVIVD